MIVFLHSVAAGDAVKLILDHAPFNAEAARVLRRADDDFSAGAFDPAATVIDDSTRILDGAVYDTGARNGETWHYAVFYKIDGAWQTEPVNVRQVTVAAGYERSAARSNTVDAYTLIAQRLRLGMQVEVARGHFKSKTAGGREAGLEVWTAPPRIEDAPFPLVTVELAQDAQAERGVGELLGYTGIGDDEEGGLSRYDIRITAWSLNPDERNALRLALRRVLLANLALLDALGIQQVEFQAVHSEDFNAYSAPLYMATITLRCLAPEQITVPLGTIETVQVTAVEPES